MQCKDCTIAQQPWNLQKKTLTHYTLNFIFYKSFWGYWYIYTLHELQAQLTSRKFLWRLVEVLQVQVIPHKGSGKVGRGFACAVTILQRLVKTVRVLLVQLAPCKWLLRLFCGKLWINFMTTEEAWTNLLMLCVAPPIMYILMSFRPRLQTA